MTISLQALTWLVSLATLITAIAPLVLIIMWIKDWRGKQLW